MLYMEEERVILYELVHERLCWLVLVHIPPPTLDNKIWNYIPVNKNTNHKAIQY